LVGLLLFVVKDPALTSFVGLEGNEKGRRCFSFLLRKEKGRGVLAN
jgi:hypothetical protein